LLVTALSRFNCVLHCRFCQNWHISQIINDEILTSGKEITPEQIVSDTIQAAACLAHEAGLNNIYISNGYMTYEMLEMISPYIDAVNIDLKAFRDETYRKYIGARL